MEPFSIVIPTWRNLEYLDLCVRGLRRNSGAEHQIIVHFNQMDESCLEWVSGRGIEHTGSERNLGVCGGVNRAAELARTRFICYMNDDMYPLPEWDTALYAYADRSRPIWLSGTAIERGNATPCYIGNTDYGSRPSDFREEDLLRDFRELRRPYDTVSTWPPTLLQRQWWKAAGGLDEAYFPGFGSDPDLAMKMYSLGCREFIGVGSSLVYHFSKSTTGRFSGPEGMAPRKYFRKKWGMSWSRFLHNIIQRDRIITDGVIRV